MRPGLSTVLLAACFWTFADTGASVNSVVATVRSAIRKKHKDAEVAASLAKVMLAERLEDRILEILESEGAGPQTLGALQQLRDSSRPLPLPHAPPPGMAPPPPPPAGEQDRVWRDTRAKSMDYTESLPDFICTETIHRWTDPTGNQAWQPSPTVVAELTFFERKEHYRLLTLGGQPTTKGLLEVGGAISSGEFGTMLAKVFDPSSETDYHWDHWTTLRKRSTLVYSFRIAAARMPHHLLFGVPGRGGIAAAVGQRGYVYIDGETGSVTRIAAEAEDIPPGFPVQKAATVLDYDYAGIGGNRFLLPLRAEVRVDAGKVQTLNTVEFQAYRKFSSDATVQYENAVPDPNEKAPPTRK
jgi:hypothetical protein